MDIYTLIDVCKMYTNLGWSVQAQLESVIQGDPLEELNGNALDMISDFFRDASNKIASDDFGDAIEVALEEEHMRIQKYMHEPEFMGLAPGEDNW